jgi:hypothetical protein
MFHPLYRDKVFSNFGLFTKAFWPEETVTKPQLEVTGTKAPHNNVFCCVAKTIKKNVLYKINPHSLSIWCNARELSWQIIF